MRKRLLVVFALVLFILPAITQTPDFASQNQTAIQHVLEYTPAASGPVNITLSMTRTWSVVGSNLTLSYSGLYDDTEEVWNGTADFNITGTYDDANQKFFPAPTSAGEYAINVTSITDPDYGVTTFQVTPIDVVFDDVTYSAAAYYWETNVEPNDPVWLVWISGVLMWELNSTRLSANTKIESYLNDTVNDFAFVDDYGQIPDLWIGGITDSWDYVNISIRAVDVFDSDDREFWSDSSIEVQMHEIVDDGTTFTFAGSVAFIRNDAGTPNLLEIQVYNGTLAEQDHADSGRQFWAKCTLTAGGGSGVGLPIDYYFGPYLTDNGGMIRIPLNYSLVHEWCNSTTIWTDTEDGNGVITVYLSDESISGAWTLANRINCDRIVWDAIYVVANEEGLYLQPSKDNDWTGYSGGTYYSYKDDVLEYNAIVGIPSSYLWTLNGTVNGDEWSYTSSGDLRYIFAPIVIAEGGNFSLTVWQTLEANLISENFTTTFEVEPSIILSNREIQVGYTTVGLSGTINTDATWNVTEGGSLVGSGTVQAGSILVYWDRAAGTGDVNFTIWFIAGDKTLPVYGTYSKAESLLLSLEIWDLEFDDAYCNFLVQTTWGNTTLYIYDNGTLRATSAEADVVQYRKLSTTGIHQVGVKIDGGASYLWKNFTYSIALIVEGLKLVVFEWDTGSPDTVSGQFQTNWANTTISIVQGTTPMWEGTEGDSGVSFFFRKTQSAQTFTVTVTLDGGGDTLTYILGYSWRAPVESGGVDIAGLTKIIRNQTADIIEETLSQSVVIPPAVFAGIIGFLVLLIAIVLGQLSWSGIKRARKKKRTDLLQTSQWL